MKANDRVVKNIVSMPLLGFFGILAVFFATLTGYVLNIITVFGLAISDGGITTMFLLRLLGIFLIPIGAILGYM